jgi:polar amino acid transport system permease protein
VDLIVLLLGGARVTASIAAGAAVFALLLAVPLGLGRDSPHAGIRLPCVIYIEFFRGTSLVVQLYWLYFVLPLLGVRMDAMTVAILGISLNYGAYGAEIVRGALRSVPPGQVMAARALGLSRWSVLSLVVAPQAMTILVRPWGNLMIQLLKATSLVSLITIADLTYRAYQMHQLTMRTLPIFGAVLIIYFVMAQCIALATNVIDRHFGRWRMPASAA